MEKHAKVYIAGHRGMVGSAICRALEARGFTHQVYRKSSELDLRNQQAVFQFFEQEKPEYVFLAAAKVGGILANNTYRADFIYDNLMIEANIIEAARRTGVKKLLFLGSSCIYPKMAPQPLREESLLTGLLEATNEPYAIAKIAGIKLCDAYRDQHGCNFISVMPTNLYGPNDNYDLKKSHVLPALIRKFHLGKLLMEGNFEGIRANLAAQTVGGEVLQPETPVAIKEVLAQFGVGQDEDGTAWVEVWGTGSPLREFLHADDLADACLHLMEDFNEAGFVNIGTGEDLSIKALAEKIKAIVGFTGELRWDNSKPDGTPRKLMDVSRLHSLGWKHKIDLDEGIKQVYTQNFLQ